MRSTTSQSGVPSLCRGFARPDIELAVGLEMLLPALEWEPTPEQLLRSGLVEIRPGHLVSEWAAG